MILSELQDEMRRLSDLLDKGLAELRKQSVALAETEHAYRLARSVAWVTAPEGMLAKQREDWVNGATAGERRARDLADGVRSAALEAVRSRRTQISAAQSMMAAHKAEVQMDSYGPR